jgi:hypothetical protein
MGGNCQENRIKCAGFLKMREKETLDFGLRMGIWRAQMRREWGKMVKNCKKMQKDPKKCKKEHVFCRKLEE